jgi:ABC-type arginine/histidine transport system permease subunit
MAWHDELYEKNRLLNKILSGIVTLTIGFLAIASTLLAVNIAIVGFNANDIFWFLSNFFILVATCYPVAELEIQNKLLYIELGALPMPRDMPDLNLYLNLYQTCAIKTSRSAFGIFVKGTKISITFNALIRIGSITLSAIIFLGGILQVTRD